MRVLTRYCVLCVGKEHSSTRRLLSEGIKRSSDGVSEVEVRSIPVRGSRVGKYYAVRNGRTNGIYHSWSDCEDQVWGFSGAQFKSFMTLEEAYRFLEG